jgi:hypothetical protein
MAAYTRLGAAALLAVCLTAGAVNAQTQPLQRGEVLGNWNLRMTPAEGGNGSITIQSDTGRLDMPMTITARGASAIACVVDGETAECQLRRGQLVVALPMDGARMTFTLTTRRSAGFTGEARIRMPLLPFGSMHLGTVAMTPR